MGVTAVPLPKAANGTPSHRDGLKTGIVGFFVSLNCVPWMGWELHSVGTSLFTVHHADAVQERDANLEIAALVKVCDNLPTVPLAVWVRTMTCEADGN